MKKVFTLFALLLTIVIGAKAQATPDYESYDWASAEEMAAGIAGNDDVAIEVATGSSDGNFSKEHYYKAMGGNLKATDDPWNYYVKVSSEKQIDKIEIFYCPNGTNKTNLGWIAYGKNVTPAQKNVMAKGETDGTTGSKSWESAVWETIDLSETEAYTVYISRSIREFWMDGATSKMSNIGIGQTFNLLGIRVYLVGTKYTVTYNLGDAVSGTAPTQADVAGGKTFTVAAAPSDLVAPTGKEFKCWNDGTNDYDEGDTYTMGTSNVTLTAQFQNEAPKYAVTYAAGEGTGDDIDGGSYGEGKHFTLPENTFTEPEGKAFSGWMCSIDGSIYASGTQYTMTAEATTFTAKYAPVTVIYSLVDGIGSAEVEAATATVNEGESLVLSNTSGRIKISAAAGQTFKAGDVITFTGTVGNQEKYFGIKYGASTSLGTNLYKSDAVGDGTVKGTLTLDEDATDIYIGRYDGTTTTITNMVIYRALECESIEFTGDVTTYVTTNALDFSEVTELTAYAVTSIGTTSVATQKVGQVPAGTALLIKGASASVPVIESAEAITNLLIASDGSAVGDGSTIYAYSKTGKVFRRVASGLTIPAGKAYLNATAGQSLDIDFDGEATGVNGVAEAKAEVAPIKVIKNGQLFIGNFNVAGQQVK